MRTGLFLSLALVLAGLTNDVPVPTSTGGVSKQAAATMAARLGVTFVRVPGGRFRMGDLAGSGRDNERPIRDVTLAEYELSRHEITNAQFAAFLNARGNQQEGGGPWLRIDVEYCLIEWRDGRFAPKPGYDDHPVVEVSWFGSRAFSEWMGARLPTEAEWEYAARAGGRPHRFPNGETLTGADANVQGVAGRDRWQRTSPVGSFAPNGLGLYDMAGNVWEWCADWYAPYSTGPEVGPLGPRTGQTRVARGGGYHFPASYATVSYRVRESLRTGASRTASASRGRHRPTRVGMANPAGTISAG